jgi:DNA excision repair protein ERCC-2
MNETRVPKYFPYKTPRAGQLVLIDAIQEEFSKGNHLCVEAANGFGKTIASLSGVLPLVEKQQLGMLYLARTHKQLDRVMEELQPLSQSFGFKGLVFRGRNASCLNPLIRKFAPNSQLAMYICGQLKKTGRCTFYQTLQRKIKKSRKFLHKFIEAPLTGLELRKKCEKERVCPYELAKQLLPLATVIATTYYSVFDSQINSMFFEAYGRPLSRTLLLLDEVHNLPRIAVEIASAQLSLYSIRQASKEAKRYGLRLVTNYCHTLEDTIQKMAQEHSQNEVKIEADVFNKELSRRSKIRDLQAFTKELQVIGETIIKKLLTENQHPISYIQTLARFFQKWWLQYQRDDVAIFLTKNDSKRRSTQLELLAMDPRSATVPVLNRCHASVHLSGTLQPMAAHIDLMGLPKDSRVMSLPSPFRPSQIFPIISVGVTTAMRYRTPSMYEKMVKRIIEICKATPHNVGVFVPSYTVLQSLLLAGLETHLTHKLFVEKQGQSSSENDSLIKAFKAKADDGAVLLGVMGGRNSEGEDYPGREMETVVIVGVPYAKPSPRGEERIDYFEQQFPKRGRLYGYHLPAMRSASQAAGRSVRTLEDRGAIVFLDNRYATPYCYRLLPSWIVENLKRIDDVDGLLYTHLNAFYSGN